MEVGQTGSVICIIMGGEPQLFVSQEKGLQ